MTGVSGNGVAATYLYDPEGNRVEATVNGVMYDYIYDVQGNESSVIDASTSAVVTENYWIGSQKVAVVSQGSTFYVHTTPVGTVRALTGSDASIVGSDQSYPFGDGYAAFAADPDDLHFAGLTYDSETGLDHAWARQYSSADGRWMTPDPYSGSYDSSNPQSFNRYSYALNSPLTNRDPSGLEAAGDVNGADDGYQADGQQSSSNGPVTVEVLNAPTTIGTNITPIGPGGAQPQTGGGPVDPTPTGPASGPSQLPGSAPQSSGYLGTGGAVAQFSGPGYQTVFAAKATFMFKPVPSGCQTCYSGGQTFSAPANFNLQEIILAGRRGGFSKAAALSAVGYFGTIDFQRHVNASGLPTFYKGFTPVSNVSVGAYLFGAGFSKFESGKISDYFAYRNSTNAGDPQQALYRNIGWNMAAGAGYVCWTSR